MEHETGLFWQDTSPDGKWVVFVEETDRKVCYAYLAARGPSPTDPISMVSDVWLCNLLPAPQEPEWKLPDAEHRMPSLNPGPFTSNSDGMLAIDASQLAVDWVGVSGGPVTADIYLAGVRLARLQDQVRRGWCRLAGTTSPLASPLP